MDPSRFQVGPSRISERVPCLARQGVPQKSSGFGLASGVDVTRPAPSDVSEIQSGKQLEIAFPAIFTLGRPPGSFASILQIKEGSFGRYGLVRAPGSWNLLESP